MALVKLIPVMVMMFFYTIIANPSFAAIEAVEFDSPELSSRYQALIAELRCTVCQNQNLADSDAELAKDLRRKTEEMLKAGQSNEEILSYMRDRYGDFVLYRPPLNSTTYLLWLGPFILLLLACAGILISIKRKQKVIQPEHADELSISKLENVRNLLND